MKNVIAVSGSEKFLRNRAIREVITTQTKKQWNVLEVDAAEPGGVATAFNHASLCGGRTLAIVRNPEKDIPTIEQHRQTQDDLVVLLLDCDGDVKDSSKLGKLLATPGIEHHKFSMPTKIWEQEAFAESFCVSEAKSYNFKMDKVLARALVEYIGTDIGVLSFEMLKIATLAEAESSQEITKEIVRSCLGTVSEGGLQQILEALAIRDARRLSKALYRFSQMQKDPNNGVMLVCRAVESKAYSWFPIIKAREQGQTPQQAAENAGINAWFYMNKLYPQTVKWTTSDALKLIQEMARSERTLLQGGSAPWAALVSRLMSFCDKKLRTPTQATQKSETVCGQVYEKLYEYNTVRTSAGQVAPPFDKPIFLDTPYVFQNEDVWGVCQKFAESEGRASVWKNRSREEGVSDSGVGSAEGKYGEFAVAQYLYENFGFPLALPDLRTESTHPGYSKIRSYDADLDYRVVNPNYPAIQVKTAIHFPDAWTIQSGSQSDRLLKGLVETKVPLKVVLAEGWQKEIYYTAYTGRTFQQDVIALCHLDKVAGCIVVDGFVPWGFLVAEKLIQTPIKNARKGGKMGIYLASMKYRAGIGEGFVVPEVGGESPLKVVK